MNNLDSEMINMTNAELADDDLDTVSGGALFGVNSGKKKVTIGSYCQNWQCSSCGSVSYKQDMSVLAGAQNTRSAIQVPKTCTGCGKQACCGNCVHSEKAYGSFVYCNAKG